MLGSSFFGVAEMCRDCTLDSCGLNGQPLAVTKRLSCWRGSFSIRTETERGGLLFMHLYITVLNRDVRKDPVYGLETRKRRPSGIEKRERNQITRAFVAFTVVDHLKHKRCPNGYSTWAWVRIGVGHGAAHRSYVPLNVQAVEAALPAKGKTAIKALCHTGCNTRAVRLCAESEGAVFTGDVDLTRARSRGNNLSKGYA